MAMAIVWESKPNSATPLYWTLIFRRQNYCHYLRTRSGRHLQFIRYAKLLYQRGAHIVVLAQEPLAMTILQTGCSYIDKVVLAGDPIPPVDYQIPLMSLPFILIPVSEQIPDRYIPYIRSRPCSCDILEDKT